MGISSLNSNKKKLRCNKDVCFYVRECSFVRCLYCGKD